MNSVIQLLTALGLGSGLAGCYQYEYVQIASGHRIQQYTRPALTEDGTVVMAKRSLSQDEPGFTKTGAILVGDGTTLSEIDLSSYGFGVSNHRDGGWGTNSLAARSEGDIVFRARGSWGRANCDERPSGAYHVPMGGGPLTTLVETCFWEDGQMDFSGEIAMSHNGTVAFSTLLDDWGFVYRGPASGPVSVLYTGSGNDPLAPERPFYNTRTVAVNNSGRVTLQMEYYGSYIYDGLLAFDAPGQKLTEMDTYFEKSEPYPNDANAINNSGTVVFTASRPFAIEYNIPAGIESFEPGVYVANPTPFDGPKDLTRVAGLADGYCSFGGVDINDAGDVVFQATVDNGSGCSPSQGGGFDAHEYDGLFRGWNPVLHAVVVRGDKKLGDHMFFDDIILGQINEAGQISFTTTYSEPLVASVKVWRADPVEAADTEEEGRGR